MIAALIQGHATLADWLFIIAAVLFVIDTLIRLVGRPDPTNGALIPAGLAFGFVALLVF